MKATGMWERIESRIKGEEVHNPKLSEAYRAHFPENETNNEMIEKITKMEQFGHTPAQIAEALNLPDEVLAILVADIPDIMTRPSEEASKKK